ncbi:EAL and HDOD domain-containing protein [Desulfobacter latus]|uniref:HDOD domain-containing protein n=1 Tax=Desulfobacter latus TaxID=2292 RepID=A0A850TEN4_9BACT|nr:HDOD domain-containing protein [Desulfobacter latus]NWH05886.1 HDOD domain-containing protein [Desulfobacter latus]
MNIFVARQPVFTLDKKIFGYELLFRLSLDNVFPNIDGTIATSGVLSNTFFSFGLNDILGGKPGLINFTRDLLLKQTPLLFPKEHIIIEILEDIEPEPEIIDALKTFKSQGFRIALDDFVYDQKFSEMIHLCDMIKFDIMATPLDTLGPIFSTLGHELKHITLLCEKVETHEEFEQAQAMGFQLFQGYFFSKPEVITHKSMAPNQGTNLKLLNEVSKQEPNLDVIKDMIKNDMAISFKLLTFINSAYFKRRTAVDTIKDAITFLGLRELKKFISVAVVSNMNPEKPNELIRFSVIKARMCEQCAHIIKARFTPEELFTVGLFSTMDAILDMPMADILEKITLSEKIKDALLGKDRLFRQLNELITNFEQGQWGHTRFQADKDSQLIQKLPAFYMDALKMADSFFASG